MHVHRCEMNGCFHPSPIRMAVLELVAQGMPNARIGVRLNRHEQTVKNIMTQLYDSFGCNDRVTLVLKAARAGVLDIEQLVKDA